LKPSEVNTDDPIDTEVEIIPKLPLHNSSMSNTKSDTLNKPLANPKSLKQSKYDNIIVIYIII